MERKLVLAVKELTQQQKEEISKEAKKCGFQAEIYSIADAEPRAGKEVLDAAKDAEVIFSSFPGLAAVAEKLKWYCTPYAGVEEFTRPGAFLSPDAILTNSSGAYGVTIAEHVVMVTLEILRREPEYRTFMSQKKWVRKLAIRSVCASRILLIGTGDIGREIAKRFRSFEPERIVGINRSGKKPAEYFDEVLSIDHLDEVLCEADLVVMAIPGIDANRHFMDAKRIARLKDGAVLVNVGRGSCIDQKALEAELRAGRISAALDVFEQEPIPEDASLWDCPNLRITPHISGDMTLPYTKERVVEMFLDNFRRYAKGEPLLRQIDLKKGY